MKTTPVCIPLRHALIFVLGLFGLVANMAADAGTKVEQPALDLRSWSMIENDATRRFIILDAFGAQAVLDSETQLVWERSPRTGEVRWLEALDTCSQAATIGGRKAWRLPTVHELASLIDPTTAPGPGPALPPGHPFFNVDATTPGTVYWTSTTRTDVPTEAWVVRFADGEAGANDKGFGGHIWCVRGNTSTSTY